MICAVVGDSLAVGVGRALPQCVTRAQAGADARRIAGFDLPAADVTVLSVGSNAGPLDEVSVRAIRDRVRGRVVWLLPAAKDRDLVGRVAAERGDRVLDVRSVGARPGHIHPSARGYRALALLAME